jgi:hypothetical protein
MIYVLVIHQTVPTKKFIFFNEILSEVFMMLSVLDIFLQIYT